MRTTDKENKEHNYYAEERELLHKQLELLAEQSINCRCMPMELAVLSGQMVSIYSTLNPSPNLFEGLDKNVRFESNAIRS